MTTWTRRAVLPPFRNDLPMRRMMTAVKLLDRSARRLGITMAEATANFQAFRDQVQSDPELRRAVGGYIAATEAALEHRKSPNYRAWRERVLRNPDAVHGLLQEHEAHLEIQDRDRRS